MLEDVILARMSYSASLSYLSDANVHELTAHIFGEAMNQHWMMDAIPIRGPIANYIWELHVLDLLSISTAVMADDARS